MPYLKDTELVALISGVHLQTVLTVEIFCAAGLRMPVEHQYFTFFFIVLCVLPVNSTGPTYEHIQGF